MSDLHVDVKGNMEWVEKYCHVPLHLPDNVFTVLICAGDVSSSLECVRRAFDILCENYDAVCFVPGNHDVWKRNDVADDNSVSKLRDLISLCHTCDIHVGPLHIYSTESSQNILDVFPLYSWYHSSWDEEPDLTDPANMEKEKECPFSMKWMDFRRCVWPNTTVSGMDFITVLPDNEKSSMASSAAPSLNSMFAKLNEPFIAKHVSDRKNIEILNKSRENGVDGAEIISKTPMITFSHFLPRQECCIEKRFLSEQHLMKVIGAQELDKQIRTLQSDLHIFGHTHIPIDVSVDGQRYIQWPLGYLREASMACAPVRRLCGPLLVYSTAEEDGAPGGIPSDIPSQNAFWSGYYRHENRMPESLKGIAPDLTARLMAVSLAASGNTSSSCPCCADKVELNKK